MYVCEGEGICVCVRERVCVYVKVSAYTCGGEKREERGKSCNEGQNIRERECVHIEIVGHLLKRT